MDEILKEKINARQKRISTNEDLSGYGYVRGGIQRKIQVWRSKEDNGKWCSIWFTKGGKNYEKLLNYHRNGVSGAKHRIRADNERKYRNEKAELVKQGYDVQIHDEWIGDTAERRGVAFVDAEKHRRGIIVVVKLLDGKITEGI